MKKQCGIYQIRNLINNKVYIGSSTRLLEREGEHFLSLKNGNHHSNYLQNAFNKYGINSFVFEVIEKCEEEILFEREQFYMDKFISYDREGGYNMLKVAGKTVNIPVPVIQLSLEGEYVKSYPSIKEAKIELGLDMSDNNITNTLHERQKTAHGYRWIYYIEETFREDIQKYIDNKIIKSHILEQIDIETGEVLNKFNQISEAEVFLEKEIGNSTIRSCLNGKYSHSHGYRWRWFNVRSKRKATYFMAIDPGKTGSVVIISEDGSELYKFVVPLIQKEIDVARLSLYIKRWSGYIKHCVIEDVHQIFGVSSKANFQFGRALGLLEGIISVCEIPWSKVQPKTWQKEMWEGVRPVQINTGKKTKDGNIKYKTDTKATSLLAAKRLFPKETFLATKRSSVPHDGIIDALLISEYCRRKFL